MGKYICGFGLSGGFGGISNYFIDYFPSLEVAEDFTYGEACELYESYVGLHGLRSVEEIIEEENVEEEEAYDIFKEERESWLTYKVVEYSEEKFNEIKDYIYIDNTNEN